MMMKMFDVANWHWVVGEDGARAWSSAAGAYVNSWDAERTTRIASEADLTDVLRPYGLALPAPTAQDYAAAIQSHVDSVARERDYGDGALLASYATSTIPAWAADAATFIAWRDSVLTYAYAEMAKVQAGTRPQPGITELIAELPAITWAAE